MIASDLQVNSTALSEDELQLLRTDHRPVLTVAIGTGMIALCLPLGIFCASFLFKRHVFYSNNAYFFLLMAVLGLGAAGFFIVKLSQLFVGLRFVRNSLDGNTPKKLVSGFLEEAVADGSSGMIYRINGHNIHVAIPGFNDLYHTNSGQRIRQLQCRTGVAVCLHLLEIRPGQLPLLLRADYENDQRMQHIREISPETRQCFAKREAPSTLEWMLSGFLAMIFLLAALLLESWLFWCAWLYVGMNFCLWRSVRRTASSLTHERVVSGLLDEVLVYPGESVGGVRVLKRRICYRVGGELFGPFDHDPPFQAGQFVVLTFLAGKHALIKSKEEAF